MWVINGETRRLDYNSCSYIVYTWGQNGLLHNYLRAQVYTTEPNGPFGH